MTEDSKLPDEQPAVQKIANSGMPWQFWLIVAFFVVFIVGVNLERQSDSSKAHRAAAWSNATTELSNDVCDAYEWSKDPGRCEQLAKDARPRIEERLRTFQK
jgi:hypothetical protein